MTVDSPRPSPRRLAAWTTVWLVLGVIHLTQAIWLSGGSSLPGGLGDSRFNNLVLEHGYQSARGAYDWSSPGQFHPVSNTLGMSDSHLGTLPLYLLARSGGLSVEGAMQLWFVVVAGLNLLLAIRLLRELRLNAWLRGPIAFAAFAGVPWVWMTAIHAQLLPIFPALWGAIHVSRFWRTRDFRHVLCVTGAILGQFATGPYLAFFSALALLVGSAITFAVRVRPSASLQVNRPDRVTALSWGLAGAGAVLGLTNLWIYWQAVKSGTGRPMQEVIQLAPTWASWFSASPVHLWWPTGFPGGSQEFSEHVLFPGVLPYLLSLGCLVWGIRHRNQSVGALCMILGVSAWTIILFTVRWPGGFSIWVAIADGIEPFRAFRAIGRIHIITHALMLITIGAALTAFVSSGSRSRKIVGAWILGALLLEGIAVRQPHYSTNEAQARREALVTAWHQTGDRPILAFAPGYTNQPDPHIQLDAWAAALSLQRHTLNGYTGGAPLSHMRFIWNPNPDQARALIHTLEISESAVSVVAQYTAPVAAALDFEYHEQRSLELLAGFDLQPVAWNLFTPLEHFRFEETSFYQFTPPCSVEFRIPDGVTRIHLRTGMRPGAFTDGKNSDGYEFTAEIMDESGASLSRESELINPRDDPAQRGFLSRSFGIPAGHSRKLVLEFGSGPANSNAWDWPLLADLKVE